MHKQRLPAVSLRVTTFRKTAQSATFDTSDDDRENEKCLKVMAAVIRPAA